MFYSQKVNLAFVNTCNFYPLYVDTSCFEITSGLEIFLLGVQVSRVTKIHVHVISQIKLATREIRVNSPVQASFFSMLC